MQVTPYLFFLGNCAEALAFYKDAAGAEIRYATTYGQTPAAEHVPVEIHDQIINASFSIGDTVLMASDCPPDKWLGAPTGYALCIGVDSDEKAEALYTAMSQGGTVIMPVGETFFAHRFGQFIDKFGVAWMIIHEKKMG